MPPGNNDRRHAFADVATLEAWHAEFGPEARVVDLHVDVVFGTGRLGEESDSPIRFRLNLLKAEIVVVVPNGEPLLIDPNTVSRDAPQLTGKVTTTTEKRSTRSFGAKIFGALSFSRPSAGAAVDLEAKRSVQSSEKVELSGVAEVISVTQSRSADGHYRWTIVPRADESLEGRPWDGAKAPRMKLADTRHLGSASLPPAVRVELRCRREDLLITELTLKDDVRSASLAGKAGARNRMAAAQSYIRDQLLGEGLEIDDLNELFSRVTIASVTAHSVPEVQ